MKRGIPFGIWILLGLLGISAFLISLGEREVIADPRFDSYSPSGSAALAELLRRSGYRVSVDRTVEPALTQDAIPIVFRFQEDFYPLETEPQRDIFWEHLMEHLRRGGQAVLLPLSEDFLSASQEAMRMPPSQTWLGTREQSLTVTAPSEILYSSFTEADTEAELFSHAEGDSVSIAKVGKGTVLVFQDGLLATNRFIDREENAALIVAALGAVASPGDQLVFTEAGFGNARSKGLLATIGAWAEAAWYQLLFLFAVIVFTLGRRFGLPEQTRYVQRGARELLDAITWVHKRSRSGSVALEAAVQESRQRLFRELKIPKDAGDGELYRLLPLEVTEAFALASGALKEPKLSPSQAFDLAKDLEKRIETFLHHRSATAA